MKTQFDYPDEAIRNGVRARRDSRFSRPSPTRDPLQEKSHDMILNRIRFQQKRTENTLAVGQITSAITAQLSQLETNKSEFRWAKIIASALLPAVPALFIKSERKGFSNPQVWGPIATAVISGITALGVHMVNEKYGDAEQQGADDRRPQRERDDRHRFEKNMAVAGCRSGEKESRQMNNIYFMGKESDENLKSLIEEIIKASLEEIKKPAEAVKGNGAEAPK